MSGLCLTFNYSPRFSLGWLSTSWVFSSSAFSITSSLVLVHMSQMCMRAKLFNWLSFSFLAILLIFILSIFVFLSVFSVAQLATNLSITRASLKTSLKCFFPYLILRLTPFEASIVNVFHLNSFLIIKLSKNTIKLKLNVIWDTDTRIRVHIQCQCAYMYICIDIQ